MERIIVVVLLLSTVAAHAESRKKLGFSRPIEVTLPTSAHPLPAPIDSSRSTARETGKDAAAKNAAPITTLLPPEVTTPAAVPATVPSTVPSTISSTEPSAAPSTPSPNAPSNENVTPTAEGDALPEPIASTTDTTTRNPSSEPTAVSAEKPLLPPAAEAAIILAKNQFFPSRLAVPKGTRIRLWFTTIEPKPAALIIEGLKLQRWIAAEGTTGSAKSSEYFELQRELTNERVTEITLQPNQGKYPFFDALSGARGELIVE